MTHSVVLTKINFCLPKISLHRMMDDILAVIPSDLRRQKAQHCEATPTSGKPVSRVTFNSSFINHS